GLRSDRRRASSHGRDWSSTRSGGPSWASLQIATLSPKPDAATDVVDDLVLLDTVLGPFRIELKLLGPLLLRLGDWDEVRTSPAAGNYLIGDALVTELEMVGRLVERRVDDRVLDDDLAHIEKLWSAEDQDWPTMLGTSAP